MNYQVAYLSIILLAFLKDTYCDTCRSWYGCGVNGGLSNWGPYSTCSVSCGDGIRERKRTCTKPPPSGGGKNCVEALSETIKCNLKICPVNGGVSVWSPYSPCSASCGEGTQSRLRECTNPVPSEGGKDCVENLIETRTCQKAVCEVDGGLSEWSTFSECSVTCGPGEKKRSRSCTNPAPSGGGLDCFGDLICTKKCNFGPCPVDGGFSVWGSYSACSVTCGDGTQNRVRLCNNPVPSNGGKDCIGPSSETVKCDIAVCKIDGGLSMWSSYSACSVSCGVGTRQRERSCTNPVPSGGGKVCDGDVLETQNCHMEACKEVNEFVKDEEFKLERNKLLTTLPSLEKEYSVSFQIKPNSYSKEFQSVIHLTIDDDIGQYGERTPGVWFSKDGSGKLSIASAVNDDVNYSFLTEPLPLAKWTSIKISQVELKGVYSFNCYVNGEPVHSIENKNPQLFEHVKVYVADPWYNAQDGSIKEIRIQNGKDEFDGGLSEWSSFSECSATCGDSTRTRTRTCTDPTPTENGKNCDGELTETVNCNVARCKETDGYNQEGVTVLN